MKKNFLIGVLIATIIAIADLFTKRLAFAFLEGFQNQYLQVTSFFNLVQVWNRGVSFGMLDGLENAKLIVSIIQSVIVVILFYLLYYNKKPHLSYAFGLIIGGAFGNLIDRLQNGAVADFLDFHIANNHWPAFNLADSAVFIGVIILLWDELFLKKK